MAKKDSLDEPLKVSLKEAAAVKVVVEEKRARLDAADARMFEMKGRLDEANASSATCC